MAADNGVLYVSGISTETVETALLATLEVFHNIREADGKLTTPIIDRDLVSVVVALKPAFEGSDDDGILAIAQTGDITNPQLFETFALKAASRAFSQQLQGEDTDVMPMERLPRLSEDRLYEASSASVNGLHVGLAGGWAHHGRLLAVTFADSLANSLDLPARGPSSTVAPLDDQASEKRLAWLNQGQDSGDNTPKHKLARERYRFILDKIVPES